MFWSLGLGEDLHESVKNVRKLVRKAKRDVVYVYSFSGVGARKSLRMQRNGIVVTWTRFDF